MWYCMIIWRRHLRVPMGWIEMGMDLSLLVVYIRGRCTYFLHLHYTFIGWRHCIQYPSLTWEFECLLNNITGGYNHWIEKQFSGYNGISILQFTGAIYYFQVNYMAYFHDQYYGRDQSFMYIKLSNQDFIIWFTVLFYSKAKN